MNILYCKNLQNKLLHYEQLNQPFLNKKLGKLKEEIKVIFSFEIIYKLSQMILIKQKKT